MAGGGPSGYLVIYNPNNASSMTIANHYQQVRGIPERNMIPYVFPSTFGKAQAWDFIMKIRQEVAARGLASQFQGIALAGIVPSGSSQTSGTSSLGSGNVTSLQSFIFLSPNYTATYDTTKTPPAFVSTNYPTDIYTAQQYAFHKPPTQPSSAIVAGVPQNGWTYWPVSNVGHTGQGTFTLPEALAYIDRAKSDDGAKPDGTIYWCLSTDTARTGPRRVQLAEVVPVWKKLGIRYSVTNSSWVSGRPDIVGGIVGEEAVTPSSGGNQFLAGAWADHLTSYGGSDGYPSAPGTGQMHSSAWIRAGADGSSGTYSEPYNDASKFTHGHIHTHFRAGCSLAEAYWQSIETPAEIIAIGDPLVQPYASFPQITISAPTQNAVVSGTVALAVAAVATGGKTLEPNLDLFVDGRRILIGQSGETVTAARTPTGFSLDTTTLTDGWHELRFAAYNADLVRTQSEGAVGVTVNNSGQSLRIAGSSTVDVTGSATFTVTPAGSAAFTSIELRMNGRVLGTLSGSGGDVVVSGSKFPLARSGRFFAVGKLADGREIASPPFDVSPDWAARAALASPTFGSAFATVRYFASTTAGGFDWSTTAPTSVVPFAGSSTSGLSLNATAVPGITLSDYTAKPGYEVTMLFYAPVDDLYEFSASLSNSGDVAVNLAIDDVAASFEVPQHLAAGWHRLRFRLTLSRSSWTCKIYQRGGSSPDYAAIPLTRGAAEADSSTEAPPQITSATAAGSVVTGTTVQLSGNATNPTGAESALTYTWSLESGPATPTFSVNGDNASKTTTATFTRAGAYVLRLQARNATAASAPATVTVTVEPTPTKIAISAPVSSSSSTTNTAVGYPVDFAAAVVDQFGQPIAVQPEITWTTTDANGSVTPGTGRQTVYRSGATAGTYSVKAASPGMTTVSWGNIKVATNVAPSIVGMTITRLGTQPINLGMTAVDANESDKAYLSYKWTVMSAPAGQSMSIASDYYPTTTAMPTGPGLYTIAASVTDGGGVTDTRTVSVQVSNTGSVTTSPTFAYSPTSLTVLLGDSSSIFCSASSGSTTLQWQISTDGGATWQDVAGSVSSYISIGPVAVADNGKKYRVVATNPMGVATSPVATLTVDNPSGGVVRVDVSSMTVSENAGQAVVTIRRTGSTSGALKVNYDINSGSALPTSDYTLPGGVDTGSVSWAAGEAADKQITIPIVNDSVSETTTEYFSIALGSIATGTGKVSANSKTTYVYISDDDGPGYASFVPSSYTINEDQGTVTLTLQRVQGTVGTLAVTYGTTDGPLSGGAGTAKAGLDYTAVSGSLSWANGEVGAKQITVPIRKDFLTEGAEAFQVWVALTSGSRVYAQVLINDVVATPSEMWQNQWWPGVSDLNVIGDNADPDKDGMTNLLEYALGSDPTRASLTQPVVAPEANHLKITFTRAKQASDVLYQVDASDDLGAWSGIWNSTGVPYGGGAAATENITVSDPVALDGAGVTKRFLRLRVTR